MTPLIFDLIALGIALALIGVGWKRGIVKMTGTLVGLVVSVVAGIFGMQWLQSTFGISNPFIGFFIFVLIVIVVGKLMDWLVGALELVRKALSMLPLVGFLNSMLGALAGAVQAGVIFLALAFILVAYVPQSGMRTIALSSQSMTLSSNVLITVFDLGP